MYRLTSHKHGTVQTAEYRAQRSAMTALRQEAHRLWPTPHLIKEPTTDADWEDYFGTLDARDEFARAQVELDERRNR
jgi:hypothetical protein